MITLGFDIGSNSVGSAWIDTDQQLVQMAVGVFPAGVDESDTKRGEPKNQARRQTRQQRRNIDRRARRKRLLTQYLIESGFLSGDPVTLQATLDRDPWVLRGRALGDPLTPHEFGRICLHMAQRRGAVGVVTDPDDPDEGKVKEGMDRLNAEMKQRGVETVGQLMAALIQERRQSRDGVTWNEPIRNRQYRMPEDRQLFAGRELIHSEFHRIVVAQRSFKDSSLAKMLTDDVLRKLDDPKPDEKRRSTWRHCGLLFGQRRVYWDTGTLGRCVLEPTERCAPHADRHASYFRVVESVNNIKIERDGEKMPVPLTEDERGAVIDKLRGPLFKKSKGKLVPKASASVTDIKNALGINPRDRSVRLNIEADKDRDINTDWFHREIAHGVFGRDRWATMDASQRESVNRAILKFDPDEPKHETKLRAGAVKWWGLDDAAADRLIETWRKRPKLERRLNLSRRAILNLLPIMERFDEAANRWPTQQEARKAYAQTLDDEHARRRYASGSPGLTAADRYYMKLGKHRIADGLPALPPAPTLSNPVVRKAIHEVRRHVIAWMRKFGRKPDRVVIEMARETKDSARRRNETLARNRFRDKIKKAIIDEVLPTAFGATAAAKLTLNQQRSAVDRVLFARQQTQVCPYCGKAGLTDRAAARGDSLEIDHIAPYSRTGDDGMNNKVLVHTECNRGKGNKTPREWWGADFDERVKFAVRLFKDVKTTKGDYFAGRDSARKWHNFNREIKEDGEWRGSQLTDTAYAARQVAAYLADALYGGRGLPERGDGESSQKIFFTMGRFTHTLRKDWQLFETLTPSEATGSRDAMCAADRLQRIEKDRGDHRQHAIDAVAIALTSPATVNRLAFEAKRAAEYHDQTGKWQRRTPLGVPWGSIKTFRRDVLSKVYARFDDDGAAGQAEDDAAKPPALIVCHRPVKRRLVGAFHEQTHYGPVIGPLPSHRSERIETLFTNRLSADRLAPNHLRVHAGWDALSIQLDDDTLNEATRRVIRKQLAALRDPPPGKSGIVRDRALRDRIRECFRANGLNPDKFTANDIKTLVANRRLTMASGVPIKGVVLLRTNTDPVIIPRKRVNPTTGRRERIVDSRDLGRKIQRTDRVYIGGNNHHIEIRENRKTRKWAGLIVPTFEAARRVRIQNRDAVDRADSDDSTFLMSLAEGEMIYARRRDRPKEKPGYFVVCKLDRPTTLHFAPHWDARKASEQDRWTASASQLRDCGPAPGKSPQKVRVGPLGDVTLLEKD